MKKYSTLILSLVFSIIIFIVLMFIQNNAVNQEKLIQVYVINQNINTYDNITKEMLDIIYISNNEMIVSDMFSNIEILESVVANRNLEKGKILLNQDLLNKNDIDNYISELYSQKVIIPISNIDCGIKNIVNSNSYVNIYVTIDNEYQPDNIAQYETVSLLKNSKSTTTFLYLEKIKPICFLDDNGNISNDKGLIKSVVLELNKKQALYINYIKGKAGFNIAAI